MVAWHNVAINLHSIQIMRCHWKFITSHNAYVQAWLHVPAYAGQMHSWVYVCTHTWMHGVICKYTAACMAMHVHIAAHACAYAHVGTRFDSWKHVWTYACSNIPKCNSTSMLASTEACLCACMLANACWAHSCTYDTWMHTFMMHACVATCTCMHA